MSLATNVYTKQLFKSLFMILQRLGILKVLHDTTQKLILNMVKLMTRQEKD